MDSSQIGVQGSVLGPLAFEVFINDLDDCANLKAVINKFADDAKLGHLVNSETDQDQLQYCLNKLLEWWRKHGVWSSIQTNAK